MKHTKSILGTLVVLLFLLSALLSSCNFKKMLQPTLDALKVDADTIGTNLGAGLIKGLDSDQLDSMVAQMVRNMVSSAEDEMDLERLKGLEHEISRSLDTILTAMLSTTKEEVLDSSFYRQLSGRLGPVGDQLLLQIERSINGWGSGLLSDEALQNLEVWRDSLLGVQTTDLLGSIMEESVTRLLASPAIDTLIRKMDDFRERTGKDIDKASKGISRVAMILGAVIGFLIILGTILAVYYYRKRKEAEQQRDLLFQITKAIDEIPSRQAYDITTAKIQEQLNKQPSSKELRELLQEVLQENKDKYDVKQQYKNYQQRLLDLLIRSKSSSSGDLLDQIKGEEEAFQSFVKNQLNQK
jgi:type II secretory pathway pseudopilin PulG